MRTFIIAEAGVNHNGDLERAKELVDAAKAANADAVKFQTFFADRLVTPDAEQADYQKKSAFGTQSQYEMLKKLELEEEEFDALCAYTRSAGLEFISTPFDLQSLDFLVNSLNVSRIKIGSGDLTNSPLILAAARTGLPVILSSGMSNISEIDEALQFACFGLLHPTGDPTPQKIRQSATDEVTRQVLKDRFGLLQCTSLYPCPPKYINLNAMAALATSFGLRVGLSDHSEGQAISVAAVAKGACIIEKHFTLDRNLPGPDHAASLEPTELAQLVNDIRCVEDALGNGIKGLLMEEMSNQSVARKGLKANRTIRKGAVISAEDIDILRPQTGAKPSEYWTLIGTTSTKDYTRGDSIDR